MMKYYFLLHDVKFESFVKKTDDTGLIRETFAFVRQ
jgi:hypothetical protein